jgi:hypothetical protein
MGRLSRPGRPQVLPPGRAASTAAATGSASMSPIPGIEGSRRGATLRRRSSGDGRARRAAQGVPASHLAAPADHPGRRYIQPAAGRARGGDAMTRKPVIAARLALAGVLASAVLASTAAITLPAVAVPASKTLASTAPAAPAASAHPGHGLVVRTDRGLVQGMNAEGTDQFLGIQYAAPPAGAPRWAAPPPARPPAGRASGRRRPTAAGAPSWPAATARGRTTRTASTSTCTRHPARTAAPPAPAMITGGCRCSS